MSNNPFREPPKFNPYESPSAFDKTTNPLLLPAMFLLVLSIVFLLLIVVSLPAQAIRISRIDTSTAEGAGEFVGGIIALLVWIVMMLVIIVGSISMLRLKGYSSAWVAAIIALIPVCSPCFLLGIPFGIWAIVLLRKPEVKSRFQ